MRSDRILASLLAGTALGFAVQSPPEASAGPPGFYQPMRHGVVFWQTKSPEEAVRELERVKADGYNLIKLASWVWTLPKRGSNTERVAEAILDWCDANGFYFYLLHNIQYGSPGEGGDLDQAWRDPLAAAPLLEDWVRVLASHPCVTGIILGNEVSPVAGTPQENPEWWAGFIGAMREQYREVAALNDAWRTDFATWGDVGPPPEGSPGELDLRRFATEAYARFYGTLFDQVCRPTLGDLEYGTKTGGDPILHRRLERFSMITWDDVLANYPQWRIKALCDIGRLLDKPVFNSEMHLYHDTYIYNQSPDMSRYRYLTSALNGETTTASFAWGQWSRNPETVAIHRHTPDILAELRRLEGPLRKLASVPPELHVLLASGLAEGDDTTEGAKPPAERLYAEVAALGRPWGFICEEDVATLESGVLLVSGKGRLQPSTAQAIVALPASVQVVCIGERRPLDPYGRPLPEELRVAMEARSHAIESIGALLTPDTDPGAPYNTLVQTEYLWWSAEKGHFGGPMTYPTLEARRAPEAGGWIVAVVNHATGGDPVRARLPWSASRRPEEVRELTGERAVVDPESETTFPPLSVRIFRLR